jgi:glucose-6-phosphate-specific signal transduction histidine kinase
MTDNGVDDFFDSRCRNAFGLPGTQESVNAYGAELSIQTDKGKAGR